MKKILKQAVNFGNHFGAGLALNCIKDNPEMAPFIAGALGISKDVTKGIFTVSNDIFKHYVFDSWKEAKDSIKEDVNGDLEKAITNAYLESIYEIERDLIEDYHIKEKISKKFLRYIFNKENPEYEAQFDLRVNFLSPLLRNLTDDEEIGKMLSDNKQIYPSELLKSIIKKANPAYSASTNEYTTKFVNEICEKFKKYYSHFFLLELKNNDKAKTVYFTHLLESIIRETKSLTKDIPIIMDFAAQANIKLADLLKGINNVNSNIEEFKSTFNKYQNEISEKLDLIQNALNDFTSPFLDKRDRHKYLDQFNKYDFKYGYLNFVGYTEELSRLLDFIGSKQDERKFIWWIITGPGGMGKSRIAKKLCEMNDGYYSGFLDISSNIRWESWKPEMPTIIVIDYAFSSLEKVVQLITILFQRSISKFYEHPVRLLLLEREETDQWKQYLTPGTDMYDSLYKEVENASLTKLEIKYMPYEDHWKIIEQVIRAENEARWEEISSQQEEIIIKLCELDELHRPLFTFLVAMALAAGENIRDWNTNDLLKNTLGRVDLFLLKYCNEKQIEKIKIVLLINTLCKNLTKTQLATILEELKITETYGEFKNIYLLISECIHYNDNDYWRGIQPDILGEFFIIKTINDIIENQPVNGEKYIIKAMTISYQISLIDLIVVYYFTWSDFVKGKDKIALKFDIPSFLYKEISISDVQSDKNMLATLFDLKARKCMGLEEYEISIEYEDLAINLNKEDSYAFGNRGGAKGMLKRYDEAFEDIDRAIELNNQNAICYGNKGNFKRDLKLYDEALVLYDKALELNPDHYLVYNERAKIKGRLNDYKGALSDFNKVLSYEKTKETYFHIGATKFALGQFKDSIWYFNEVISKDEDMFLSYYLRSIAYFEIRKYNEAIDDLNILIHKDPASISKYLCMLGQIYFKVGDKSKGIEFLKTSISLGNQEAKVFYDNMTLSETMYPLTSNDLVSVVYTNGHKKNRIKFGKVAKDFEEKKCIIVALHI